MQEFSHTYTTSERFDEVANAMLRNVLADYISNEKKYFLGL